MAFRHRQEAKSLTLSKFLEEQRVCFLGLPKTQFVYDNEAERFTLQGRTFELSEKRISELELEVQQKDAAVQALKQQVLELEGRVCHKYTEAEYDRLINSLEAEKQTIKLDVVALREENAFEEKRAFEASETIRKLTTGLEDSKKTEASLELEIQRLEQAEKMLTAELETEAQEFSEHVARLERDKNTALENAHKEVSALKLACEAGAQRVKAAEEALRANERLVAEFDVRTRNSEAENELLERKMKQQTLGVDSLRRKYDVLEQNRNFAESAAEALTNLREVYEHEIERTCISIQQLEALPACVLAIFEKMSEKHDKESREASIIIEELEAEIRNLKNAASQVEDAHRVCAAENVAFRQKVEQLEQCVSSLEIHNMELRKEVENGAKSQRDVMIRRLSDRLDAKK